MIIIIITACRLGSALGFLSLPSYASSHAVRWTYSFQRFKEQAKTFAEYIKG